MNTPDQHALVHLALLRHASERPAAPFLLAGAGATYREAACWVGRLARSGLLPPPGSTTAIWMGKGNTYALGILAALFAGSRYLPLDGAQPVERANTIVNDAGARVLIVDRAHAALWLRQAQPSVLDRLIVIDEQEHGEALAPPPSTHAAVVRLSADLRELAQMTEMAPAAAEPAGAGNGSREAWPPVLPCAPDDVAAVLYTSGSTGQPKGVQLSHRNLGNFVRWSVDELALRPEDRLLNLASFNFDLSTFDLFASLRAGAALYVGSEAETRQVALVADILAQQAITVLYTVPSMLALLNRADAWARLAPCALRRVAFAGEVMPKPQLRAMARQLAPDCRFYNFYGPTETNVCLYHRVSEADLASDAPLPIGTPVTATEVWLQDEAGQPIVQPGQLGEIWVRGDCVTPGYWRREADPNTPNHRLGMHATGDYGELVDGLLVYRGRKDRMLKLNGYRIELGEIEAALARHPAIHEVAVLALPGHGSASPRVHAWYVTRAAGQPLAALDLKRFCADFLPSYMIPHGITQHAALPRTPNGKIDYRQLGQQLAQGARA